jgi:enoyl-CoA hydratase/carnithine racemase
MRLGADRPMAAALEVEETAWNEVVSSPDRIEGIAAFVERRRPIWPSARKRGD